MPRTSWAEQARQTYLPMLGAADSENKMGSQGNGYAPDTSLVDRSASWHDGDGSVHVVQFYEDDAFLVETLSRLIGNALRAGDATIVIATGSHRDDMEERIRAGDLDLEALREQGRYVSLDAGETLSKLMVDG
jgi:hypothetical protein